MSVSGNTSPSESRSRSGPLRPSLGENATLFPNTRLGPTIQEEGRTQPVCVYKSGHIWSPFPNSPLTTWWTSSKRRFSRARTLRKRCCWNMLYCNDIPQWHHAAETGFALAAQSAWAAAPPPINGSVWFWGSCSFPLFISMHKTFKEKTFLEGRQQSCREENRTVLAFAK